MNIGKCNYWSMIFLLLLLVPISSWSERRPFQGDGECYRRGESGNVLWCQFLLPSSLSLSCFLFFTSCCQTSACYLPPWIFPVFYFSSFQVPFPSISFLITLYFIGWEKNQHKILSFVLFSSSLVLFFFLFLHPLLLVLPTSTPFPHHHLLPLPPLCLLFLYPFLCLLSFFKDLCYH